MPVRERVQNRYGTLHGGCTATLVDTLTTAALLTVSPLPGVSMVLSVNYVAPMPGTPVPHPPASAAEAPVAGRPHASAAGAGGDAAQCAAAAAPTAMAARQQNRQEQGRDGSGDGSEPEDVEEEVVVIDARVVKAGRQVATLAAELRRKRTGQLVATGSHTKFVQVLDPAMGRLKQLASSATGMDKPRAADAGPQQQLAPPPRSRL
ncbi:hypothetical protein HYH02_004993 [Chlamydomonas schloesseri]|uniref:Thioesterase domain-containing protein n=1 Tax=Chlamydomonas schloesseri TaxID=2026947 RepID=A0A835WMR6_9CHLO|nr:hypothetical protein HYH02_004993 [Chlamydomonas schloesseri]|eukprot:KAG2450492.1 hypothetical protein HYH02_004993 [Chlamydomonas schloesseri]